MTILYRYLAKQNFFLVMIILLAGTGVYAIADLFENLDHFIENESGVFLVIAYIGLKIPGIISQILPAVFFVATILQLNFLDRSNELIAIRAGGVSPMTILKFICIYGLLLACLQFVFSQVIGVEGQQVANTIWKERVKGDTFDTVFTDVWFIEGDSFVSIESVDTVEKKGEGLAVFTLGKNSDTMEMIIHAKTFAYRKGHWELFEGNIARPELFEKSFFARHVIPLKEDLKAIATIETTKKPAQLSLWELSALIKRLTKLGSNIEGLRVAWHSKIAYALSVLVVGLYAVAISQATSNVYKGIASALFISFLYHSLTSICITLGNKGALSPLFAAWFPITLNFAIVFVWLGWTRILYLVGRRG